MSLSLLIDFSRQGLGSFKKTNSPLCLCPKCVCASRISSGRHRFDRTRPQSRTWIAWIAVSCSLPGHRTTLAPISCSWLPARRLSWTVRPPSAWIHHNFFKMMTIDQAQFIFIQPKTGQKPKGTYSGIRPTASLEQHFLTEYFHEENGSISKIGTNFLFAD